MPLLRDPSPARPAGSDVEPFVSRGGNPKEREFVELVQKFSLHSPHDVGAAEICPSLAVPAARLTPPG